MIHHGAELASPRPLVADRTNWAAMASAQQHACRRRQRQPDPYRSQCLRWAGARSIRPVTVGEPNHAVRERLPSFFMDNCLYPANAIALKYAGGEAIRRLRTPIDAFGYRLRGNRQGCRRNLQDYCAVGRKSPTTPPGLEVQQLTMARYSVTVT
jgi:hypothetical protein